MNIHEALGRKIIQGRDIIPWGYGVGPCPYDQREIWIYPLPFNHLVYWAQRLHYRLKVSRQHEMITVKEADEMVRQKVGECLASAERNSYITGYRHGWLSREGRYVYVREYAPLMAKRDING